MKKNKLKPAQYIGLCVLCLSLFCSCRAFMGDNEPPIPEENPVYISKDAQTIVTRVKNLSVITPQNPETDKVSRNEHITDTENSWIRIESEWISFYQYRYYDAAEKVEITVKENTTGESRTYVLGIASKRKESKLIIFQEAE